MNRLGSPAPRPSGSYVTAKQGTSLPASPVHDVDLSPSFGEYPPNESLSSSSPVHRPVLSSEKVWGPYRPSHTASR